MAGLQGGDLPDVGVGGEGLESPAADVGEGELGVADDHIAVTDAALAQIPDEHRHGSPILVRADGAGGSNRSLAHLRFLRDEGGLDGDGAGGAGCVDGDLPEG
jgi:hypothetical protein